MFTFTVVMTIWIIGIIAMWVWDAFIGFGKEFDKDQTSLGAICFFWGFFLPIILFETFADWLKKIKSERLFKEAEQEKIRIKAQEEIESYMLEAEATINPQAFTEEHIKFLETKTLQKNN